MKNENPYKPVNNFPVPEGRSLRPFILLNAGLVLLPLVMVGGLYTWTVVELFVSSLENDGDPATYQHFLYIESHAGWLLTLYVAVPNVLLALVRLATKK